MCLPRSETLARCPRLTALDDTVLEASTMFQSSPGTSALLSVFQEGLASGKKRRTMAAAKQIPVSMLSGFLGSGCVSSLHSVLAPLLPVRRMLY